MTTAKTRKYERIRSKSGSEPRRPSRTPVLLRDWTRRRGSEVVLLNVTAATVHFGRWKTMTAARQIVRVRKA